MRKSESEALFLSPGRHPTLADVAGIFGLDYKQANSAQQRCARRKLVPNDGRMLGTPEEKELLGHYAKEMAMRCLSQSRYHLAVTLADMIRQRTITPLTHVEKRFLENMERATPFTLATAISANWFKDLETRCELEYVKASSQQEKRTEALTRKACLEHFTALDDALANLDFVDEEGSVKPECKCHSGGEGDW